ncbi:MAG: hypothetical protein M1822_001627 [Bathelium mastoideum]|nr:MAG: hypothetical protein M1822_001627 [Bathelium mastoideum]
MDITNFVFSHRDTALAVGDYSSYRVQLTRKLSSLRKKLGKSTPKNIKFDSKATITSEDVGTNYEFVHLLLLISERAWAHAMHLRSSHVEDQASGRVTGSARSHILSRLDKASKQSEKLVALLRPRDTTHSTETDLLEAEAYHSVLRGAEKFERDYVSEDGQSNSWKACLSESSKARVIYQSLLHQTKRELFKEVLAGTVDPTVRYAAYKLQIPRSLALAAISKQYFPKDQPDLAIAITKLDPNALSENTAAKGDSTEAENVPNSITWRSRTANIADASIGQALAAVNTAARHLQAFLDSPENQRKSRQERAAAYDDVLISSQDTVDVTRRAIEELEREGVVEGDVRMQDLRVTDLTVNYALIGWRVGRNRILIGTHDGLSFSSEESKDQGSIGKDGKPPSERLESNGKISARLRDRIALFDAILQSIDSVKELRGAARDNDFMNELEAKKSYFRALRCANIAYSHDLDGAYAESLALTARAHSLLASSASALISYSPATHSWPPTLEIADDSLEAAQGTVAALLHRRTALTNLQQRSSEAAQNYSKSQLFTLPNAQRLMDYPPLGAKVDLGHLVAYPPKLRPVPVKPIFLDVAWNYVDYPGHSTKVAANGTATASATTESPVTEQKPAKKGWFGFGR